MDAVTVLDAKRNLEGLIARAIDDAEPTIVCSDSGQRVVVLSLDEFNSWKETLYLLSNPANAAHLARSVAEADAGRVVSCDLDEA